MTGLFGGRGDGLRANRPPGRREEIPPLQRLRVVVVDESPFVCRLLATYLDATADIQVVGIARTGTEALPIIRALRPNVVTLAVEMTGMTGLDILERIMHECPTPVILISGVSRRAAQITSRAIELGAVDFILKFAPGVSTNPEALRQDIVTRVRMAARVKVIRSLASTRARRDTAVPLAREGIGAEGLVATARLSGLNPPRDLVVVGASTGGPMALRELLENLPGDFPAAVVIVQHMPAGFTAILADQLDRQVSLKVKEARDGDQVARALVLVAPGDYHLLFRPGFRVELVRDEPVRGHRPSIDLTMQSAVQLFGAHTYGIVLTGMGEDGVRGLKAIRNACGRTFAQDTSTCVISSMPQCAIQEGVVDQVAAPAQLASALCEAVGVLGAS
jgi:two-component system chemotaxis response regulator CheB